MTSTLKDATRILSGVRAGSWQKISVETGDAEIDWLPLIPPKAEGAPIGITRDGHWAVLTPRGIRKVHIEKWGVPLLIALEYPLVELKMLLVGRASEYGMDTCLAEQFPFREAVAAAFEAGNYWVPRALSWLAEDPSLMTTDLKLRLKQLSGDKRVPQKIRQEARRLSQLVH